MAKMRTYNGHGAARAGIFRLIDGGTRRDLTILDELSRVS
jgi:hypothetical protein